MPIQLPKRVATIEKYIAITRRFNQLHNHPDYRKRIDDCYKQVSSEFFVSEDSVVKILALDIEHHYHHE